MMSRPRRAQTTIVIPAPQVSSSVRAASIADVAGLAPALSAIQQALNAKASADALAAKADADALALKADAAALALKADKAELAQAISQIVPIEGGAIDPGPGLEVVGTEVRINIGALPLAPEN